MKSEVSEIIIGLGSNLGDRIQNIKDAIDLIKGRCGTITALSSFYETKPIGVADKLFINAAAICESTFPPQEFIVRLKQIEKDVGRTSSEKKWDNRIIDCDILLWRYKNSKENLILNEENLIIPHPYFLDRDFALVPAVEVAGTWVHPMSGNSLFKEILEKNYRLESL